MSEILKDDLREIKDNTVYSKQTVFAFDLYGETGKGGRAENQDSFWFGDTSYGLLLIVCDGMGGGPGGRTASTLAVQEIGNYINQHPNLKPGDVVIGSVLAANRAIYTFAKQHLELMGMGSTCVVALLTEEKAIVCHVGDSRLYQLRGHKELFHTSDHSQVYEMVKNGIMNEEEARLSPISNVITKALGLSLDLKIEIKTDTSSDILELPYQKGDRFVLCTDGIHGVLANSVLIKELSASGDLENILNDLHSKIHQLGVNSGNQHDNLTLIMAVAKDSSLMGEAQRPSKFVPKKRNTPKMHKYLKWVIAIVAVLFIFGILLLKSSVSNNTKDSSIHDTLNVLDTVNKNTNIKKDNSDIVPQKKAKSINDETDYGSFIGRGKDTITPTSPKNHQGKETKKGKDIKQKTQVDKKTSKDNNSKISEAEKRQEKEIAVKRENKAKKKDPKITF